MRRLGPALVALLSLASSSARADAPPEAGSAAQRAPGAAAAAQGDALELSGELPRPGPVTVDELKSLGAQEATWTAHGEEHRVLGVRLDKLLRARGFTPGPMGKVAGKEVPKSEKRAGWRRVVLATAADGYQALFGCAEIDAEMGPTQALLIWQLDGKPLPAGQGPLRLVVLTDREPSRSIYAVRKLELLDVPKLAGKN